MSDKVASFGAGCLVGWFVCGITLMAIGRLYSDGINDGRCQGIAEMQKAAEQYGAGAWVPNAKTREFEWKWTGEPATPEGDDGK